MFEQVGAVTPWNFMNAGEGHLLNVSVSPSLP